MERLTFRASIPWLAWFSAILGFILNAYRRHLISKIFFISSWILFVTVLPVTTGKNDVIALFLHPFYCMVTSVIIHLIFSQKREKWLHYFFVSIVWVSIIFSYEFIMYFNPTLEVEKFFVGGFFRWRLIILMLAAFFNASILYLIRLNQDFYVALQKQNDTISEQNKTLECQHKNLEELKVQLEEKVAIRTQLLQEQNSKLREYTFFNSHILRAPVSRIRGLLNLLSRDIDDEEKQRIRLLLTDNMNELDTAIKSINDKLQQVESHEEV
jgi:signal transduction histidine kinase